MIDVENIEEKREEYKRKKFKLDILFNAENKLELAKRFHQEQPYFWENGLFWFWNYEDKKWQIIDEIKIMNLIDEDCTVASTINSKQKNEIIEALKRVGSMKRPKDPPKTWIQFKDIVIDVKTGDMHKISFDYFFCNPIPHNLDWKKEHHKGFVEYLKKNKTIPDDDYDKCEKFDKLFEQWVGKEYVETLYEIIGYCMLPDYPLHRIFCFVGSGLNGKGTFLTILSNAIGHQNTTSTELDNLIDSRFEISRMYKKLACLIGETNFNAMDKTSMLKKLCGGDLIGFEYKNKNPFEDYNYAKLIVATNSLPITHDKTIGFYRRWLIIDFPNRFTEKKSVLEGLDSLDYESLVRRAVNALQRIIHKREFANEGSIEDRMQKYEDRSNPLQKFIKIFTQDNPDTYIAKFEFRDKYQTWLKDNGYRVMNEREIGMLMKERYETGRRDFEVDGEQKRWMCFLGLNWMPVQRKIETESLITVKDVKDVNDISTSSHIGKISGKKVDKRDKLDTVYKTPETINKTFVLDTIVTLHKIEKKQIAFYKLVEYLQKINKFTTEKELQEILDKLSEQGDIMFHKGDTIIPLQ